MAKNRPTGSEGATAPISGHRLFPAVISLWGTALFGLVSALVPASAIERAIAASGIATLFPAAGQPLTFEVHMALALVAAAIGGWLGLWTARRITVAQYNALPTSSNRMARITRQAPVAAGDNLSGTEFGGLAVGGAANLALVSHEETSGRSQPQFDLSSDPISIWGDAPPAAVPGTYGPELPELLLSEDLQAEEEPQWQERASPADAEETFFEAYVDWPSEPANDYQSADDEPRDALPETAPLEGDWQQPEADLFSIPAVHLEPEIVQPEDEPAGANIEPDAPETQADWEIEPETGWDTESPAEPSEPNTLLDAGSVKPTFGSADQHPPYVADEEEPVLPTADEEIGQYAREAQWPSTSPSISADLDSFGEPEEEDEAWPESLAGQDADEWDEEEEAVSSLDTTLGAFRDYARDYTGGDDGEEEEEEEEEDDSSSSFGSLLGMTVRRRAADEPIELVGFDGEPVALSDCEIQFPDDLETDEEYDSPLLVRRRMGGA